MFLRYVESIPYTLVHPPSTIHHPRLHHPPALQPLPKLPPHLTRRLMLSRMAPAGRHDQVEEFVFNAGGFGYVFGEGDKFSEVGIQKTVRFHFAGDSVFDGDFRIDGLVGTEDPVPDIEQVAKIRIHVEGIPSMVNAVVHWR